MGRKLAISASKAGGIDDADAPSYSNIAPANKWEAAMLLAALTAQTRSTHLLLLALGFLTFLHGLLPVLLSILPDFVLQVAPRLNSNVSPHKLPNALPLHTRLSSMPASSTAISRMAELHAPPSMCHVSHLCMLPAS